MEKCLDYARNQGAKRVELSVRVENKRAIKLYKKFGFQAEGRLRAKMKIGNKFYDEFIMGLVL
jgi:RimJ/RimL family protein N-acetyltransferase